jgi:hypothetical protein
VIGGPHPSPRSEPVPIAVPAGCGPPPLSRSLRLKAAVDPGTRARALFTETPRRLSINDGAHAVDGPGDAVVFISVTNPTESTFATVRRRRRRRHHAALPARRDGLVADLVPRPSRRAVRPGGRPAGRHPDEARGRASPHAVGSDHAEPGHARSGLVNLIPRRCNATRVEEGRPCQPAREDRLRLRPGPLTRVRGVSLEATSHSWPRLRARLRRRIIRVGRRCSLSGTASSHGRGRGPFPPLGAGRSPGSLLRCGPERTPNRSVGRSRRTA